MKQKLFTLFLALVASVSAIYAQSGSCGDNLTWTLSNGTLTISGTGAMENFAFSAPAPWYDYRSSIKSVIISDGVTSIGAYAFRSCSSLTSVTIGNSVTSIGESAFGHCYSLTSVTIPNSVTSIGGYAFSYCSSLTSLTILNSVTSIGDEAFLNCSSLTSINVDANNSNYCSIDGVLFNKDKTTLIQYPIGNTRSEYTIPNSVTSIGNFAFYKCSSLTSVTIPNSVTSIGFEAFYKCSSLTSVTIPNSVTSIGSEAFRGCSSLTSVTIGNGVTEIGGRAFDGTSIYNNAANRENGVLYINNCLIDAKTSISGAYAIKEGTRVIAGVAFGNCSSLTSVTIPNSVTSIGKSAFFGCSSLTSVTIPNSVTSIGESAFDGCSSLTSVTIPNSVTSIGESAFDGCDNITSITWNVKKCADFSSSSYALFYEIRTQITSFAFGDNVEHIPAYLCYGMKKLTSITIPNSVTSIGRMAFGSCSSLTSVTINSDAIVNKAYTSSSNLSDIFNSQVTEYIIGDNVKGIGEYTFCGCSSLTSITIPNSVTSIGERAFYECSSLTSINVGASNPNYSSIDGVLFNKDKTTLVAYPGGKQGAYTIPNSVTSIGGGAFDNCSSLTSVTIPNSVTNIGKYAFGSCSSLTSVTISNSVTSIGAGAFWGCESLTSITIPNSVTSIGQNAFYGTSIYNNAANWVNGVLYINNCLIDAKTSISGAYAIKEGTRVIADYAFYACKSLTSITIPKSVTSIGRMAFAYDDALVAINVEQGNRAYSSVDGVLYNRDKTVIIAYPTGKTNNSYTILDGVNTIDSYAFIGNEHLEYINMPKTLISIDYGAFANCTKLIEIVIPKTVRSIGSRAFYNCASLKKIYNNAIIPQEIDDQTFEKVDILNCELYVMPMAFTNYYNANIWKDFGLIETIEIGGIDIDDSKLEFTTTQKQANVLWAANSKATLYLLSMRRVGSEDTYTFTFDENGYLISSDTNSLDFSKLIYLQNAAYSLTITDFDTDATYVYSFLYKDNEGNILHSESGQFSPDEFPEGIENVHGDEVQSTKVVKDGQVLILRNGKTYTMQGQEVK